MQLDPDPDATRYWDDVAESYDALYDSKWSKLEDSKLEAIIASMVGGLSDPPVVVDLGCGTGFGFDLVSRVVSGRAHLVGVDGSTAMLTKCEAKHPGASLHLSSIEDAHEVLHRETDLALLLSVTGSYVRDLAAVLRNLRALLRPDARVLVSVLSRFSLRRLLRGRLSADETYRTRGDNSPGIAPVVRTYSYRGLRDLTRHAGYAVVSRHAGSPFAGVIEWPALWPVGEAVGRVAPWLGHSIDLVLRPR